MTSRHYIILYVILSHFGVHKATWAARKAGKLKKMQRRKSCHDLAKTWHDLTILKHGFDIVEIVSRWQKCDTIWGNLNSVILLHKANRVMIYLKCDTILGKLLCLLKLKTIMKTRVTNLGEKKCDLQTWRLKNGQFPPFYTSLCMF